MGNALGVAAGIAMTTDQRIWVNLSDASLQMGNTLEALQFIGHNKMTNVFVTVDYNGAQVTGNVDDILTVDPIRDMCRNYGWLVKDVEGHDRERLITAFDSLSVSKSNIVFCHTKKGYGVKTIEQDIKKWHYKKIETLTELQSLVAELRAT